MNILDTAKKAELSQNMEPELRGWRLTAVRIFKFFASLKLAVMVLVALMAVLAAGTFIESAEGTDAARLLIYQAPWFSVLLFLLAMNLFTVAIDRLPWKVRHIGFVITHLGIILILFGSFLTQRLMVDGQISIAEGETEHRITLPDPLLYIYSERLQRTWFFDLPRRAFPWRGEQSLNYANDGEETPFEIKILTSYPKALMKETLIPAAEGNPAIKIKLKNTFVDQEQWLMKNSAGLSEVQMGPALLKFTDEILPEQPGTASESNYLEFEFLNEGKKTQTIQIPIAKDLKMPAKFSLKDTPYQIEILGIYHSAVVDGKKLIEDPDAKTAQNPAAEFILTGPELNEKHTVFSKFPDFPTVHGMKPSAAGVKVFYRMANAGSRGERHEIRFILKEGKLICQIVEGMKVLTVDAEKGKEIPTGWMGGLTVRVEEFYPASALERSFLPEMNLSENPTALPALQIRFLAGGEAKTVWLRQGIREEIEIAEQPFTLVYGQKRIPAGFKLQLKDFRLEKYPGTDRPASFESDVLLKDDSRGVIKEVTISMNNPLAYRGYHIYQSGYSIPEGEAEISTFSVGKDPGVPVKYAGAIVMVAGILTMFYTRRFSSSGKTL